TRGDLGLFSGTARAQQAALAPTSAYLTPGHPQRVTATVEYWRLEQMDVMVPSPPARGGSWCSSPHFCSSILILRENFRQSVGQTEKIMICTNQHPANFEISEDAGVQDGTKFAASVLVMSYIFSGGRIQRLGPCFGATSWHAT